MGQDPRTFLNDAVVFIVRFYVIIFVVLLPITVLSYILKPAVLVAPAPAGKASLPPNFEIFFVLFGIYMFCAVATAVAFLGGWRKLASQFPAPQNYAEGQLFKRQSGSVGAANYNKILYIRVSAQGLYLACIFPFRFMHPPLLVPWAQVKALRQKRFLWRTASYLTIGSPKLATIALENQKVVEAAQQWLP